MQFPRRVRRRPEQGAAAVEFGLVVVILLTLIIGIIQFSIWFWAYQVGAHAAREGARLGAVAPCAADEGAIITLVTDRVGSAAFDAPVVGVDVIDSAPAGLQVGDEIRVTVTYTTHTVGGLIPALPAITKSATSRIEHIPAGPC